MPAENRLREILMNLFCRNHLHAKLMKGLTEVLHKGVEVEAPVEDSEGKKSEIEDDHLEQKGAAIEGLNPRPRSSLLGILKGENRNDRFRSRGSTNFHEKRK